MARKFGKVYKMSTKFEDYSYIINGIGGIGKTTAVYEIGKIITGSNEGTFIITCGAENKPKHINDAFGDIAPDAKTFMSIVKELCDNRAEYPDTKFIAVDSMDEFARIFENYVVAEWNASCDISERARSISQAYKGYQKGENRACDLMIQQVMKLQDAGYSLLLIGHTKTKTKEDVITKIQFEQLTCNLDNKYYNALKDKVNLVAMCYFENTVENVEEKKNAFTKKMNKVGELVDRKRVMVFADDDNAIDCKSHFEYIIAKIDFSAQNFIDAVHNAIEEKLTKKDVVAAHAIVKNEAAATKIDEPVVSEDEAIIDDEPPFDIDDEEESVDLFDEESEFDVNEAKNKIRTLHKSATAEQKAKIKTLRAGARLDDIDDIEILSNMLAVLE